MHLANSNTLNTFNITQTGYLGNDQKPKVNLYESSKPHAYNLSKKQNPDRSEQIAKAKKLLHWYPETIP